MQPIPGNPAQFGTPPCGPLKEQIQRSQDWQPNQGIRGTPLVLGGTVAETIQRSQIQGLANLTQGLETLHWCLAARWRIYFRGRGLTFSGTRLLSRRTGA